MVINADTRLALVNALYVRGPWQEPLDVTGARPFAAPHGTRTVPMITARRATGLPRGKQWRAARLPLLGGELAVTVVRPERDLETMLTSLDRGGLGRLLRSRPDGGVSVTLPRFTFGSRLDLVPALATLGMPTAFGPDADFGGLTEDDALALGAVVHQGHVALDEDGVEAAAATVVTAVAVSAVSGADRELIVDRPFLFCIHDVDLALPLLVGVVNDPVAAP